MALAHFVSLGPQGGTLTPLTDQGRTFDSAKDERAITVTLASGLIRKYFLPVKYTFSIAWSTLPNRSALVFDGKGARDAIKDLVDSQQLLTLTVQRASDGSPKGATTSYDVWVESYTEKILRRDAKSNSIWYDVQLELKQQ
jgi:hypothetical protein